MSASEHLDGVTILPEEAEAWAEEVSEVADGALPVGGSLIIDDPSTQTIFHADIVDDASPTGDWPDRIALLFNGVRTSWFNEYGEARHTPAKRNTVGWRMFAANNATNLALRDAGSPVWEIADERGQRNRLAGINHEGNMELAGDLDVGGEVTAPNIGVPIRAVLDHDEEPTAPTTGDIYLIRPEP